MYSALIYDVMKSYLTRALDKKIRNGCITLEKRVLYDKLRSNRLTIESTCIVTHDLLGFGQNDHSTVSGFIVQIC